MWKILVAFIAFAAVAMFVIMKGGDSLDMGGEKHGGDTHAAEPAHAPAAPAAAPAAAGTLTTAAPAAPAADATAPAAK